MTFTVVLQDTYDNDIFCEVVAAPDPQRAVGVAISRWADPDCRVDDDSAEQTGLLAELVFEGEHHSVLDGPVNTIAGIPIN